MFPKEVDMGSIEMLHKSHISTVVFTCAVSRPDPTRNFHRETEIPRVCVIKEAQRTTTRRHRGGENAVDTIVDYASHREWGIPRPFRL